MQVVKPNIIGLTDGSFSRASTGTFFDATGALQTAAINTPRFNYNRVSGVFEGLLIEPAATNFLLNSSTLSTQSVTVTAQQYTLSFYGTGSITLSGAATGVLVGNTNVKVQNVLAFVASAGTLTLTVSGSVTLAQLETGTKATSYIATTSAAVSRSADIITGTNLIYSSATESTAAWASGTTYALGARVRYLNQIWESLQAANTNRQPDTNPTWWFNVGYDNLHAAFDGLVTTPTSATTELTFVVKTSEIDAVSLINIDASVIEVAVRDQTSADLLFSANYGLSGANVQDWYQYFFFDPLAKRTQLVITGLPAGYPNAVVSVRMKNTTGVTTSLGNFIAGETSYLGQTQMSPTIGIIDYSRKETDQFGNTVLVQRAFSKRMQAELFFDNSQLNRIQLFLTSIRATPVLWVASDDPTYEEALVVYGFYRDFSTTIAYPQVSLCSLEIEGLT